VSQGVTLPFPPPLLWFKPEGFNEVPALGTIGQWYNMGAEQNADLFPTSTFFPTVVPLWANSWDAAHFTSLRLMALASPVILGNSWSLYIVFDSNGDPTPGMPGLVGPVGDLTRVSYFTATQANYRDSVNNLTHIYVPHGGVRRLLDVQKQPSHLLYKIDTQVLWNIGVNPLGQSKLSQIVTVPPGNPSWTMAEIMVFAPVLTTIEDAAVKNYFHAKYNF
jgi:hypothetical protein